MDNILVVDFGSYRVKAGFSSQDEPILMAPSMVGTYQFPNALTGKMNKDTKVIGRSIEDQLPLIQLDYPLKSTEDETVGIQWEFYEDIWNYLLNGFDIDISSEIVFNAKIHGLPMKSEMKIMELLFEKFGILGYGCALQTIGLMISTGKFSGTAVDIGHSSTRIIPFFKGTILEPSVATINIGGKHLTEYLGRVLIEDGKFFQTQDGMFVVNQMKEKCAFANPLVGVSDLRQFVTNFHKNQNDNENISIDDNIDSFLDQQSIADTIETLDGLDPYDFDMPDGGKTRLDAHRYQCVEPLFQPNIAGVYQQGIHSAIIKSIKSSDLNVRKELYGGIMMYGSTSSIPFLQDRMLAELQKIADPGVKISFVPNIKKDYAVWQGLANLASNAQTSSIVLKTDFEEDGAESLKSKIINSML
ncbi:actin-5c-related [Anaeramoeba ignava]|uniref:Actin-5c-related n=1 Tax=Anaeramoeba ignava TaxID=1746090 RepID=A0A9Q0LDA8_ANAIG|nr:actin-5c-related [Anaeramoeba ignava]